METLVKGVRIMKQKISSSKWLNINLVESPWIGGKKKLLNESFLTL
jgi:hypothetical protein